MWKGDSKIIVSAKIKKHFPLICNIKFFLCSMTTFYMCGYRNEFAFTPGTQDSWGTELQDIASIESKFSIQQYM